MEVSSVQTLLVVRNVVFSIKHLNYVRKHSIVLNIIKCLYVIVSRVICFQIVVQEILTLLGTAFLVSIKKGKPKFDTRTIKM